MTEKTEMAKWFGKHVDAIIVLAGVAGATLWMNNSINSIRLDTVNSLHEVDKRLSNIETVLILNGIMPTHMVQKATTEGDSHGRGKAAS